MPRQPYQPEVAGGRDTECVWTGCRFLMNVESAAPTEGRRRSTCERRPGPIEPIGTLLLALARASNAAISGSMPIIAWSTRHTGSSQDGRSVPVERPFPRRQERRSVSSPRLQESRTARRPNIESFQPDDPNAADRQARSDDRLNQAGAKQRTSPPAQASSHPSLSTPAGPQSNAAPASTRQERKPFHCPMKAPRSIGTHASRLSRSAHQSFPQDDIKAYRRCGQLESPCLANPPASHRTVSFHRNDQRPVPADRHPTDLLISSATSPGSLRFASPMLDHTTERLH